MADMTTDIRVIARDLPTRPAPSRASRRRGSLGSSAALAYVNRKHA
jgi:hypothetical protein